MSEKPIVIAVHVTPRSGRDEVSGVRADTTGAREVCVRVTAPPDGGKANKAVCKLVADALSVPKSRVEVASGHTARRKRLAVEADAASIEAWIAGLPVC
ncbi:DUF167 domain-containing protein [Enteroscipio rubneri]|uniref:DUF167 domain-containing protein n=1 Tax=Enteroscipio rubneri TaxID=2070686 RepID=UPI00320AAAB5